MQGVAWTAQQMPSMARQQDAKNSKKQSSACHSRQRRARRGRAAGQGACRMLTSPEAVLVSLPNGPMEAMHFMDINTSDNAWTKGWPTGMELVQPPVKAYKHAEASRTFEVQMDADSPLILAESPERCSKVLEKLENGSSSEQHTLLQWLLKASRKLALSKPGCRIVQKAFDVAGTSDRDLIIMELKDHIVELYESPWGNHVLSRAIEVIPSAKNNFVISALLGRGVIASKHRFGCRIVCRLIEHCTEEQIGGILDEVLVEANLLAHHAYGNFVVQSLLEHALPARRCAVLSQILPDFATLAMHRTGSLVAQRALAYCQPEGQNLAIRALLQADETSSLVEVACNHYGSYVMEQLAGLRSQHGSVQEIAQILASNLPQLLASEHAEKVMVAFGVVPVAPLTKA